MKTLILSSLFLLSVNVLADSIENVPQCMVQKPVEGGGFTYEVNEACASSIVGAPGVETKTLEEAGQDAVNKRLIRDLNEKHNK